MGWSLYSEGRKRHTDGKEYWIHQDRAAREYAGVFYLRWKWEDLEPEEGKYAWECDSVFINLIQGALDRNLRLAFRAFVHTGTPKYVNPEKPDVPLNKNDAFQKVQKRRVQEKR